MQVNHKMDTLIEQLGDLRKRGFNTEFKAEKGYLLAAGSDKKYTPADVKIVEHHRFEGESSADDMSVVYAIEADDGTKGAIVNSFGIYSNPVIDEFIKKIEEHQYKQLDEIK